MKSSRSLAGGVGEVHRARDIKLGRDLALKVLPAAFVHDIDIQVARFWGRPVKGFRWLQMRQTLNTRRAKPLKEKSAPVQPAIQQFSLPEVIESMNKHPVLSSRSLVRNGDS
jgi:hypothetical protein